MILFFWCWNHFLTHKRTQMHGKAVSIQYRTRHICQSFKCTRGIEILCGAWWERHGGGEEKLRKSKEGICAILQRVYCSPVNKIGWCYQQYLQRANILLYSRGFVCLCACAWVCAILCVECQCALVCILSRRKALSVSLSDEPPLRERQQFDFVSKIAQPLHKQLRTHGTVWVF